ncbi:hypothetical protein NCCP2716_29280 [Sporosarcina sp. NCCP-2716]|nr:hypothetical protein NCCP2716_29280 [Sporosarcina sp. NCCP-2716]
MGYILNELELQDWNSLVNKVGEVADNLHEVGKVGDYIRALNSTLQTTNFILGIIAVSLIALIAIKLFKSK